MTDIIRGNWMGESLKDMLGKPYAVGDKVARAYTGGRATNLEIRTVTRIDEENTRLYLNDSKVAINYPQRLLIVTKLFEESDSTGV